MVGPEAPLAAGVVDVFRDAGSKFGPTRAAAQLESSKDFAKSFMARHGIPTTAEHRTFERADDAPRPSSRSAAPIVVKADGLAAGKGVVVAASVAEAHAAIDQMLTQKSLAARGPSS